MRVSTVIDGRAEEHVIFRQFLHEQRSCASYLIGCASKGVAAVVDPQGDISEYVAAAERHGLRITDVLDSHVHADHPSAARELAEGTGAACVWGSGRTSDSHSNRSSAAIWSMSVTGT
jgi:glyoxylase-like metal-dependent hydrolase (beta-lactamase superfamily II)